MFSKAGVSRPGLCRRLLQWRAAFPQDISVLSPNHSTLSRFWHLLLSHVESKRPPCLPQGQSPEWKRVTSANMHCKPESAVKELCRLADGILGILASGRVKAGKGHVAGQPRLSVWVVTNSSLGGGGSDSAPSVPLPMCLALKGKHYPVSGCQGQEKHTRVQACCIRGQQ